MRRRLGWLCALSSLAALMAAPRGQCDDRLSAPASFRAANAAYRQAHYDAAIAGYRAVLQEGVDSGALYYNLGNALLKREQHGEALWAYHKAAALLPRDADVQANLAYARSLLAAGDQASLTPPRWARGLTLRGLCSIEEWARLVVALLWLTAFCWMLAGWLPQLRAAARPMAWVVTVSALWAATALGVQTWWTDGVPTAITISDHVEVKFAPQANGTTYFTVAEGTVVRVLEHEGAWVHVRRADGRAGWIDARALRAL